MGMILTRIVWLERVRTCIDVGWSISCIVGSRIVVDRVSKCPASKFIHRVKIPLVVIIDGVVIPKVDGFNTCCWGLLHEIGRSIVSVALGVGLVQFVTVPILAKLTCWQSVRKLSVGDDFEAWATGTESKKVGIPCPKGWSRESNSARAPSTWAIEDAVMSAGAENTETQVIPYECKCLMGPTYLIWIWVAMLIRMAWVVMQYGL